MSHCGEVTLKPSRPAAGEQLLLEVKQRGSEWVWGQRLRAQGQGHPDQLAVGSWESHLTSVRVPICKKVIMALSEGCCQGQLRR